LKQEEQTILKTFADNPTQVDLKLSQRLKEIEILLKKFESDWLSQSEKINE